MVDVVVGEEAVLPRIDGIVRHQRLVRTGRIATGTRATPGPSGRPARPSDAAVSARNEEVHEALLRLDRLEGGRGTTAPYPPHSTPTRRRRWEFYTSRQAPVAPLYAEAGWHAVVLFVIFVDPMTIVVFILVVVGGGGQSCIGARGPTYRVAATFVSDYHGVEGG